MLWIGIKWRLTKLLHLTKVQCSINSINVIKYFKYVVQYPASFERPGCDTNPLGVQAEDVEKVSAYDFDRWCQMSYWKVWMSDELRHGSIWWNLMRQSQTWLDVLFGNAASPSWMDITNSQHCGEKGPRLWGGNIRRLMRSFRWKEIMSFSQLCLPFSFPQPFSEFP